MGIIVSVDSSSSLHAYLPYRNNSYVQQLQFFLGCNVNISPNLSQYEESFMIKRGITDPWECSQKSQILNS